MSLIDFRRLNCTKIQKCHEFSPNLLFLRSPFSGKRETQHTAIGGGGGTRTGVAGGRSLDFGLDISLERGRLT